MENSSVVKLLHNKKVLSKLVSTHLINLAHLKLVFVLHYNGFLNLNGLLKLSIEDTR